MVGRKLAVAGFLLALTLPPASTWGQQLRVELFPPPRVAAIVISAGRDATEICRRSPPRPCLEIRPGERARCVATATGVRCAATDRGLKSSALLITSSSPFLIDAASPAAVRHQALARVTELTVTPRGLRVISNVDLESYVAGVLAGEASTIKSRAALEAMAVVVRTWALRSRGRHRSEGFDFCSLTHCQVFGPAASRSPRSVAQLAVLATQGEVLNYGNALADLYFSADCGGVTEAAGNLWPDKRAPYLISARDPYCAASEHARWQQTISLEAISTILRNGLGLPPGARLRDLNVSAQDESGRARTLLAVSAENVHFEVDANQFRYAVGRRLGWNVLKSNLYTVERRGGLLVFTGRGLGHGVGLCQAGADQMGRMGADPATILAAYFPGTRLERAACLQAMKPTSDPVASSEHFELDYPASQESWVSRTLQGLESARRALGEHAEVLAAKIRVATFDTTTDFVHATGQPGFVAASTDGNSIALQPLRTLQQKGILESTLRHEVTHLVVHRRRDPRVPEWFEEGLVLHLTGERIAPVTSPDTTSRTLQDAVQHPESEAEMRRAYAVALRMVAEVAERRGAATVWQMLEHPSDADIVWLRSTAQAKLDEASVAK